MSKYAAVNDMIKLGESIVAAQTKAHAIGHRYFGTSAGSFGFKRLNITMYTTVVPPFGQRFYTSYRQNRSVNLKALNSVSDDYQFVEKVDLVAAYKTVFTTVTPSDQKVRLSIYNSGGVIINGISSELDLLSIYNAIAALMDATFERVMAIPIPTVRSVTCSFNTGTTIDVFEFSDVLQKMDGIQALVHNRCADFQTLDEANVTVFGSGKFVVFGPEIDSIVKAFDLCMRVARDARLAAHHGMGV